MVALARKSLRYEWRRYLPAMLAVAFSGVLLFAQTALVLGIFATTSVFVSTSAADLWVGYPQTPSVDLGRPVPEVAEMRLQMDPDVVQVDALQWRDATWQVPGRMKHIAVVVAGVNPSPDGLLFAHVLPPAMRVQLTEPGAVMVDPADVDKLGIDVGEYGFIQGHRVRLIGLVRGLRSLGAVTIVASAATARVLDPGASSIGRATYYLARLRQGARAAAVRERLQHTAGRKTFEVWTTDEFRQRTIRFWLFDTGAGLGFVFAAVLVLVVGTVTTSQALLGAIAGSVREFATLRALGVTRKELATVIFALASWLGGTGLLLSAIVIGMARTADVPIAPSATTAALCALAVIVIAWASGLASMTRLAQTDPAELLRA
jgi:putative ABC transport system permease protein